MKNTIDSLIKKGVDCCEKVEFKEGVMYFDKALMKDALNPLALHHRARALSKLGQIKFALVDFKVLTVQFPQNASFIADYAVALHLDNQNEKAALQFEQALALEPTNPYRYASRAYFKDRTGDSEGAIQDYEKAIELDPEDAIALNNKGLIEEKLGYKERANKSFDKSNSIVGYNPSEKAKEKKSAPNFSQVQKPSSKEQNKRWAIIKSVFTKEGFKDFTSFTKTLIEKKEKE